MKYLTLLLLIHGMIFADTIELNDTTKIWSHCAPLADASNVRTYCVCGTHPKKLPAPFEYTVLDHDDFTKFLAFSKAEAVRKIDNCICDTDSEIKLLEEYIKQKERGEAWEINPKSTSEYRFNPHIGGY